MPDAPDINNPGRVVAAVIMDAAGNQASLEQSEDGNWYLATAHEHIHYTLWNHYFNLETAVQDTTNGVTAVNSKTIVLNDATGFSAGDSIDVHLGATHCHCYREIISIATNTLSLDAPVDTALPDGSQIDQTSFNMAVDGSSVDQVFTMKPRGTEEVDITRLILELVHSSAGDDGKFGGISALTNGVHIRRNINNGESYQTIAVWRSNKDIKIDMYDLAYAAKAPGGENSTTGRWTFTKMDVALNLKASNNEFMECVIRDDLTGLTSFEIKMQGHYESF